MARPPRPSRGRLARTHLVAAALQLTAAASESPSWPPFLLPPDAFTPQLRAGIEHVWRDPTLSREAAGRAAAVPFETYVAFVDAPDVTAAAARLLRLARREVRALGDDWYEADDHDGARGVYRLIARTHTRRVMISWGQHRGWLLGTVRGSALIVVDLTARDGRVEQSLSAYVQIDSAVAATLARLLVPIFGHLADRKLTEGFAVTASVAEWAVQHPPSPATGSVENRCRSTASGRCSWWDRAVGDCADRQSPRPPDQDREPRPASGTASPTVAS